MSKYSVLSNVRREFITSYLKKGKRNDGREFMEYRPVEAETGVIENAEGSALVRLGTTQVIAGVKVEIIEPFPQEPDTGIMITNAELLPLASPQFEPGPPDERSIEFARVVDRGIRSAEVVDLKKYFIEEGKALGFFVDLYVLDYDGNLFDAGTLAAGLALKTLRVPKVENGEIIRGEYNGTLNIDINNLPTSSNFTKIGDSIIVDPSLEEEMAMDAQLIVNVTKDHVVAMQKRGVGSFKKSEVLNMVDNAFDKRKDLEKILGDMDA